MPELDPTNSTTAPLTFKSAATHSAGKACPPVPPPAIRILGLAWFDLSGSLTVLRYPVEDTHGGEAYQQTRPTVAHEGERHPREREDHHGGPDVEDGLDGAHPDSGWGNDRTRPAGYGSATTTPPTATRPASPESTRSRVLSSEAH